MSWGRNPLITPEAYKAATKASAEAQFAEQGAAGKFVLPIKERQIISDWILTDSPVFDYAQDVTAETKGAGTIEFKFRIHETKWFKKTKKGDEDLTRGDIRIDRQTINWNVPYVAGTDLTASDIARGVPNLLADTMNDDVIDYFNNVAAALFAALVDDAHANKAKLATALTEQAIGALAAGADTEAIRAHRRKLIVAIGKFIRANSLDRSSVITTLDPELFALYADAGMIGDRANRSFIMGDVEIGMMGGYKVRSGEVWIPETVTGMTKGKIYAYMGTGDVGAVAVDIIALNYGKKENTNDLETYVEIQDSVGTIDWVSKFKKAKGGIITDIAVAA